MWQVITCKVWFLCWSVFTIMYIFQYLHYMVNPRQTEQETWRTISHIAVLVTLAISFLKTLEDQQLENLTEQISLLMWNCSFKDDVKNDALKAQLWIRNITLFLCFSLRSQSCILPNQDVFAFTYLLKLHFCLLFVNYHTKIEFNSLSSYRASTQGNQVRGFQNNGSKWKKNWH